MQKKGKSSSGVVATPKEKYKPQSLKGFDAATYKKFLTALNTEGTSTRRINNLVQKIKKSVPLPIELCQYCGHAWVLRTETPKFCAKCHNPVER